MSDYSIIASVIILALIAEAGFGALVAYLQPFDVDFSEDE